MKNTRIIGMLAAVALLAGALPALATPHAKVANRSIAGTVVGQATNELTVKVGKHTYTATLSDSTLYRDRTDHNDFDASLIEVGDHVKVYGVKNKTVHTMTAVTKVIDKDVTTSIITGKVTSLATNEIKFSKRHQIYTTTESDTTVYLDKHGDVTDFSSFEVGDKIKVWGQWHTGSLNIVNVTKVRELSPLQ